MCDHAKTREQIRAWRQLALFKTTERVKRFRALMEAASGDCDRDKEDTMVEFLTECFQPPLGPK